MKKVVSLLLVMTMLLTIVPSAFAASVINDAPTLTIDLGTNGAVDARTVADGGNILVPVTLKSFPAEIKDDPDSGISGVQFTVNFDPSVMTYNTILKSMKAYVYDEGEEAYTLVDAAWNAPGSDVNTTGTGNITFLASGGATFTTKSFEDNPVMFTLRFKKVAGAKGTSNVTITNMMMSTTAIGEYTKQEYHPEYFIIDPCVVTFTDVYSATVGEGIENGTVELSVEEGKNIAQLDAGDIVTINATPATGYELDKILVNGTEISGNTYTIVDANAVVTATFKPMTIAIDYPEVQGISWASSPASAPYGSEVTIVPTLAEKYKLTALAADGVDILETKTFTVNTVNTIEITAAAEYVPSSCTVTATSGEGYTVNGAGSYTEGDTVNIEVIPETGYEVAVTATGITLPTPAGNKYTFEMPANDVAINVVATKKVYKLDPEATDSTVKVEAELKAAAKVTFMDTEVTFGSTVRIEVMPLTAAESINPAAVKAKGTGDVNIPLTLLTPNGIELKGYGYEYSFTMPADGNVEIYMADGEEATLSADATLSKVTIGYQGNVDGTQTAMNDPFDVTSATTLANLSKFADPDYGDNYITITPTVAAGASFEVLYNDVAYTNNVELGSKTEEFKIKVTAEDGKTTKTYTVKVKNATDPDAGATIEFVATPNLSVAKGSSVTVSILAKGIQSQNATGLDMEIKLPKAVILNNGDEFSVDVHEGAGVVNAMNTITYDEATGILKAVVLSTNANTLLPDPCEVAVVTFTVDPETTATKLVIGDTGTVGEVADGQNATPYPMTVAPAELDITEDVENLKAKAIEEIENYLKETDYTYEQWNIDRTGNKSVLGTIEDYKDMLDDADVDTKEEVEAIVIDAKAALDAIETLAQFKDRISSDAAILNGIDTNAYATEDSAKINAIIDAAQEKVDTSESREEDILNGYVEAAQAEIAAVPTLAARKEAAIAKLVVDESLYTAEGLAGEVATAIAEATTAINNAEVVSNAVIDEIVELFLNDEVAPTVPTDKIAQNIYTLNNLKTTNTLQKIDITVGGETKNVDVADGEIFNAYTDSAAVLIDTVQAEKISYLNDYIDTVLAQKAADGSTDLFTAEAKAKIEIYEFIAETKIESATSEAEMNKAIKDAIDKIAVVPTVDDAAKDALEKISVNEKSGYDIDDIIDTGAKNVDPALEAYYEAAIEAYKKANNIPGDDANNPVVLSPAQMQEIIDNTNAIVKNTNGTKKPGDFTCNDTVDIQDPAGTMSYVCNVVIEGYLVGAQNIVNADLHCPGDGILTVFDVVEIMKLL